MAKPTTPVAPMTMPRADRDLAESVAGFPSGSFHDSERRLVKEASFRDEASLPGSETASDRGDQGRHELPVGGRTVRDRAVGGGEVAAPVAGDGSVAPRAQGGDTRSGRIETHGLAILAMVDETPDITLVEIAERLEQERGERFAPSTIHRFFRRHGWSLKKSPPTPASRTAKMSPRRARLVQGPAGSGSGSADLHRRDPGSCPGQHLCCGSRSI